MKDIVLGILLSLLSAFVGCVLPFISIDGYARNPINLIWGFLYGFGWYVAGMLSDPRNPWAQMFGGIVWPIIIMGFIVYLARFLSEIQTPKKILIVSLLFLSLFVIVPQKIISGSILENMPTYYSILFVVY
jgi:hypothetical protein